MLGCTPAAAWALQARFGDRSGCHLAAPLQQAPLKGSTTPVVYMCVQQGGPLSHRLLLLLWFLLLLLLLLLQNVVAAAQMSGMASSVKPGTFFQVL